MSQCCSSCIDSVVVVVVVVVVVANSLKPLDVAFMRAIHQKVNIVPVIAKADTLTKSELTRLKHTVCIVHCIALCLSVCLSVCHIVPVIAKADTLTKSELTRLKKTVCILHCSLSVCLSVCLESLPLGYGIMMRQCQLLPICFVHRKRWEEVVNSSDVTIILR